MKRAGLLLALLWAGAAAGQTVNSGVGLGPSQQVAQPLPTAPATEPVAPKVEHLLGDLGGLRPALEDRGVYVLLDAISEFGANVSGGTRQGATFANQVGLEIDVDWSKLGKVPGLATHVIMVDRSGSSVSHLFGDDLLPVQEIYGAGGNVGVHLVSAYMQETLFGRRLDIAAGRMNVENDFASSPLYCNYMNNVLCGDPKALPGGDIGHSAYPDGVWALRVRARPLPTIYVQSGVYEVNQGLYGDSVFRSGFRFDTSRDSGVYVPVEAGWEPHWGDRPGHYKLGFGWDSSHYQSFPVTLDPASTARHGNTQFWALADQILVRQGEGDTGGIIALAGYIRNDPHNSAYGEQVFAGLLDRGFWAARNEDTIGLLFSYNTVSSQLGRLQAAQAALGLPLANGATGVQTHEMILEVNYDIHVARGVNFQPEFQYVFRPNGQGNIRDAAVLGFKAHVAF